MVTAAAVLAFIWGGLGILSSILLLIAGSLFAVASTACDSAEYLDSRAAPVCDSVSGVSTLFTVISISLIVVAALMIAGGVMAMTGRSSQILIVACACYAILVIILIASSPFWFGYTFGVVLPVLIVAFLLSSHSRAWFRSVGGRTF